MSDLSKTLGRKTAKKAATTTVRHSVRGFGSKAKRQPLRSAALLGAGGALGATVGAAAGWLLGRRAG